jgi:hypothetical protein
MNNINCKIYKIVCDCGCGKLYVGSTKLSTLAKRMAYHRHDSIKRNLKHLKLYQHMNDIGTEHFNIVLLEAKTVKDNDERRALENKWIVELDTKNNGYNSFQARTTYAEAKQKGKERYEVKRELIKNQVKNLYEKNKVEGRFMCTACNTRTGSNRDLQRHLHSEKHQKKIETASK